MTTAPQAQDELREALACDEEYTEAEFVKMQAEAENFRLPAPPPIPVRALYYLTGCKHCGWIGSSEQCGVDTGGDDSDVYCPVCCRGGCESAPDDGEQAEHGEAVMARITNAEADIAAARETIARQAGEIAEVARLREALRPFLAIRCSFDGFGFEPADLCLGNTRVGSISSADHQKLQGMLDDARAALTSGAGR